MKLPVAPIENKVLSDLCGGTAIKWDVVEIGREQPLRLRFHAVNSLWRQGVWLRANPGILVYEAMHKALQIWQDNSPPAVEMTVSAEDDLLHVYNIWDSHRGYGRESQSHTSGMLIEQTGNVRTYRCHDIGNTPDFSKLVFSLEFV
jgi:hypothetical protein